MQSGALPAGRGGRAPVAPPAKDRSDLEVVELPSWLNRCPLLPAPTSRNAAGAPVGRVGAWGPWRMAGQRQKVTKAVVTFLCPFVPFRAYTRLISSRVSVEHWPGAGHCGRRQEGPQKPETRAECNWCHETVTRKVGAWDFRSLLAGGRGGFKVGGSNGCALGRRQTLSEDPIPDAGP